MLGILSRWSQNGDKIDKIRCGGHHKEKIYLLMEDDASIDSMIRVGAITNLSFIFE
jgi:hypothetical protein